jgi:hypothetical protein
VRRRRRSTTPCSRLTRPCSASAHPTPRDHGTQRHSGRKGQPDTRRRLQVAQPLEPRHDGTADQHTVHGAERD